MKPRPTDNIIRSLEDLKSFIGKFPDRDSPKFRKPDPKPVIKLEADPSDHDLFKNAMEDVTPFPSKTRRK
ncbi:MAG: hypothetical protein AB1659_07845, partial [Thermodesulfobacteriota bacterium]